MMPTSKKTTTTKKPSSTKTTRKKRTTKKVPATEMVTAMDKEQLVSGLQKTIKDMGKLPWIFLAPVITYVSSKYDSIPESRRKKLEEIVKSSKEQWWSVLTKLKDWFMDRFNDAKEAVTEDKEKKPVKKRAPRKKSTPRTTTKKATTTKRKTTTKSASTSKTKTPRKKTTTTKSPTKTPRKTTTKKASE